MDTSTALEASPSSSPSSSSSTTSSSSPYDVFLSFSEDTRKTFTDHLYWTMKDAEIDFFMEENESIRRGENISDKVKQIIEGSRVSVIVFSSRYADSIWCLEELVQIMECRRTLKQMVLPIFYDLSPSDVIGTFELAFQKHRERFHEDTDRQEKLRRWTDALTAAAGLTVGTDAAAALTVRVFRTTNGYEGMFIREIIDEITRQLKSPTPVGIAFSELQRLHSPKLEDIDFTEHTDTAASGSSAKSSLSMSPLKKRCHEPDHSDSPSIKFLKTRKESVTTRVPADKFLQPDGHTWRKSCEKELLGSSRPISYYRCTYSNTKACPATKLVEGDPDDPAMLMVTNIGVHNHDAIDPNESDQLQLPPLHPRIDSYDEKEFMFEKPLTPSDVGKLNRLVIPKQHAEKYFPLGSADSGLLLNFEDESGKRWRFSYSYWNSNQCYVFTRGWSRYLKEKRLDAGDVVSFERLRAHTDRLFIGWRRQNAVPVNHSSQWEAGPFEETALAYFHP